MTLTCPGQYIQSSPCQSTWSFPMTLTCPGQYIQSSPCQSYLLGHFPWLSCPEQYIQSSPCQFTWSFPMTLTCPEQYIQSSPCQSTWSFHMTLACPGQYIQSSPRQSYLLGHFTWLWCIQASIPKVVLECLSWTSKHATLGLPFHSLLFVVSSLYGCGLTVTSRGNPVESMCNRFYFHRQAGFETLSLNDRWYGDVL